jgi:hypothetical protein
VPRRIKRRSSSGVSICTFVPVKQVNSVPVGAATYKDPLAIFQRFQHGLLPHTSAYVSIRQARGVFIRRGTYLQRFQHGLLPRSSSGVSIVSICTFVPVKHVNFAIFQRFQHGLLPCSSSGVSICTFVLVEQVH